MAVCSFRSVAALSHAGLDPTKSALSRLMARIAVASLKAADVLLTKSRTVRKLFLGQTPFSLNQNRSSPGSAGEAAKV
jgi:hypothetical protein